MPKTSIFLVGHFFELSAVKVGDVQGFPFSNDKLMHDKYIVTVSPQGRKSFSFSYYNSAHAWEKREPMTVDGLRTAFYNFMGDADAGRQDFSSVMRDFGYDLTEHSTKRIYNALQKAFAQWEATGLGDVSEYLNDFQEKYPDNI
jgi:hypothetical protein